MDPQHDWRAVKALEAMAERITQGMSLHLAPDALTAERLETAALEIGNLRRAATLLRGDFRKRLDRIASELATANEEAHRANLLAAADLALRWGSLEEPVRREACRDAVRLLHALWEEWSKPENPKPREESDG